VWGFEIEKLAFGEIFLGVLMFSPVCIITPTTRNYLYVTDAIARR
jgi:hypothetical protein